MVGGYLPQKFMKVYMKVYYLKGICDLTFGYQRGQIGSGREHWWVEVFLKFPLVGDQSPTENPCVCVYIHIKTILQKFHDAN